LFAEKSMEGFVVTEIIGHGATVDQLVQVASELLK